MKTYTIFCNNCSSYHTHELLFEKETSNEFTVNEGEYITSHTLYVDKNQLLQCKVCSTVSFRVESRIPHQIIEGGDSHCFIWPPRSENHLEQKLFEGAPMQLIILYNQIIESYNNEYLLLAQLGIKAVIKGICFDKYIDDKDFEDSISKLLSKGLISKSIYDTFMLYSYIFNQGMNKLQDYSKDTIRELIRIVELTILCIYDIPTQNRNIKNEIEDDLT